MKNNIFTNILIGLFLVLNCSVSFFAQTKEEIANKAKKTYDEAVELSETNKLELIPQALQKFQTAQELYKQVGEKRDEANANRGIGRSYLNLNNRNEALKAYEKALKLFEEIPRKIGAAIVLTEIGFIYFNSSDKAEFEIAFANFKKAEELLSEINDDFLEIKDLKRIVFVDIAEFYYRVGNNNKAVECFKKSLTIAQEIDKKEEQSYVLYKLGLILQESTVAEEKIQAFDYYKKNVGLLRTLKDKKIEIGLNLEGMGIVSLRLSNEVDALKYFKEALSEYKQGNAEPYLVANTLRNLGLAYESISLEYGEDGKNIQEALNFYLESAQINNKLQNNREIEADLLGRIGVLFYRQKNKELALQYYQKALNLNQELSIKDYSYRYNLPKFFNSIGQTYEFLGNENERGLVIENYQKARTLYEEDSKFYGENNNFQKQSDILVSLGYQFLNQLKDKKEAFKAFENSILAQEKVEKTEELLAQKLFGVGIEFGKTYEEKDTERALKLFQKSFSLYKAIPSKQAESGDVLNSIGNTYYRLGNREEALKAYQESLKLLEEGKADKQFLAKVIKNLGDFYSSADYKGNFQIALKYYLQELELYKDDKYKWNKANTLNFIGRFYVGHEQKEEALKYYNDSLKLFQEIAKQGNSFNYTIAHILIEIGRTQGYNGTDKEKALEVEYYRKAQAIYEEDFKFYNKNNDFQIQIEVLRSLGYLFLYNLKNREKALATFKQSVALAKKSPNQNQESSLLNLIANVYSDSEKVEDLKQSLEYYKEVQILQKKSLDINNEIWTLKSITKVQHKLGNRKEYLETSSQLLKIAENLPEVEQNTLKAEVYFDIGNVYMESDIKEALRNFELASLAAKSIKDKWLQVDIEIGLIQVLSLKGDWGKVKEKCEKLILNLETNDFNYQAKIGLVHYSLGNSLIMLGESSKGIKEVELGMAIIEKSFEGTDQGNALAYFSLAKTGSYMAAEKNDKVENSYKDIEKNFPIIKEDTENAELFYFNLSGLYLEKDKAKSLEYAQKALLLSKKNNNKILEAFSLHVIIGHQIDLGKRDEATESVKYANLLYQELGMKPQEAISFGMLMDLEKGKNPQLSLFYGKKAIKLFQEMRKDIKKLDKELQKNYLRKFAEIFNLVSIGFIEENRLDEAQQIINLSRDQEFYDLPNQVAEEIQFNPTEAEVEVLFEAESAKVRKSLRELDSVKMNKVNTQNDEGSAKIKEAETKFKKSYDEYLSAINAIGEKFNQPRTEKEKTIDISDTIELQKILKNLSLETKPTAALYTLIGDDSLYILLNISGEKTKVFKSSIKKKGFNKKLLEFYSLLKSKVYDPRKLGKELYDTIIPKELENELKQKNVQTLMWSLDGNLRYIPMAAISPDGKQYLVEKYNNIVFTRVEARQITEKVSQKWTGYGFFSSESHKIEITKGNFIEYPSLDKNEKQIFRTANNLNGIDGKIFIETEFTKESLFRIVEQKRPLVHISSHFRFYPGDSELSFLVLGNGKSLPLSELKESTNLFQGVELLTLSACETAVQFPDADGKEIDGFAEVAQTLGADSVMASLWLVSDTSTTQLMKTFYTKRQENRLTKVEALRQTQLELINGGIRTNSQITETEKGNSDFAQIIVDKEYLIPFDRKSNPRYSHPYYWAPFILFGNPK